MEHILLAICILVLSACGGDTDEEAHDINDSIADTGIFVVVN